MGEFKFNMGPPTPCEIEWPVLGDSWDDGRCCFWFSAVKDRKGRLIQEIAYHVTMKVVYFSNRSCLLC